MAITKVHFLQLSCCEPAHLIVAARMGEIEGELLRVLSAETPPGRSEAGFCYTCPSTTLADLFTLLFAANPFSAAWASPWRWSSDEFEDGLAHGGQCRSRRRPVDSFFPALLF